jgi:fatty acid desaturase
MLEGVIVVSVSPVIASPVAPTAPIPGMAHLTADDVHALGQELDAIHRDVVAALGQPDADYIRGMIKTQRVLELLARAALLLARRRPAFVAGTVMLTVAKILENMEIGHNVMHGQYDWMNDPRIRASSWEWDAVSTSASWRHSHNYEHHTYTNVVGKDRDLGYSALRISSEQAWHPVYLLQPLYGAAMALIFEWAIAIYDIDLGAVGQGTKTPARVRAELRSFARKAGRQLVKDFVVWPALAGRSARPAALANLIANVTRNVWVHTIVFMGHLPDGAETFSPEQAAEETRGEWYVRQMLGSCNLEGTRLFHIMSGSLSFQIEHHLFPDVPSCRYPELARRVRPLCARYELPYNSGRLGAQYRSVAKKILRYALP